MMLAKKNVMITGCGRGIGRSLVEAFAEQGANIWACCRNATTEFERFVASLARDKGVRIEPLCFELTDAAGMKEAIKVIMAEKAPLDVLVNNAGITYNALFQMTTLDKMRELFEVNFFAQMALTQYVVKLMVRQKSGCIINVASTAAMDGNPGRSAYGASKAAIICVTRAMAYELAEANIRVNAIAPGLADTEMVATAMTEAAIEATIRQTRLKRIGKPSEIAAAAVFLASDLSSYVTGQVLRVDGGLQS